MQPAAAPTLAQRILAHLRDHPVEQDAARVPVEVTQEGIAACLDARVAHVSRALKHLMEQGLVHAHLAHPDGARRRSRAHRLTREGLDAARTLPALLAAPATRATRDAPPSPAAPPAGREKETATLTALLDEASAGAVRVALVEGDSGAGKTRLLRAFAAIAKTRGARILQGSSVPVGGDQLLGPLGPAFAGTSFEARLRARAGGTPRERALHAAVDALEDAARAAPVVLLLDDLHHAGANVAEFLHGILLALPPRARVLFVLAFRREEAWQLPNGALYTALFPLHHLPGARHLVLGPLGREGLARLLEDAGMDHVEGPILDRVARESGGIPLYALSMAEALADGNVDDEDFFPPPVRALVRERFLGVHPDAVDLLQLMAVAGAETTFGLLRRAWEGNEESLVRALDHLLDRLLVIEAPGGGDDAPTLRFEHPKIREAALADLTASRRRWLEERVAEAEGMIPSPLQQR